ncbi:hypothetical protein [Nitrospira sp. BLG_2]|uniref:hypothetical protein n=1 Tax=Nitrospira sp. BLG_2 TaxID=3397507 RepID=UPI003BA20BE5
MLRRQARPGIRPTPLGRTRAITVATSFSICDGAGFGLTLHVFAADAPRLGWPTMRHESDRLSQRLRKKVDNFLAG